METNLNQIEPVADDNRVVNKIGEGLNYDFCPQFNKYVYWLKKPIGWVICGAAFSALIGAVVGPQGFVLMWSFLALLLIGTVWPWLSMKGINCSVRFTNPRSFEGEPTSAVLEITNRWPLPIFGLMIEGEFLQDINDDDDRIAVGLQRIPGWSICRFEWSFEPERRGKLPVENPKVTNGFPFGLYKTEQEVEVSDQTIVWPKRHSLEGQPQTPGTQRILGGVLSDQAGHVGDFIGVREFRRGDSMKDVHWKKTATTGELVAKERHACAQKPVQILVDLSAETHSGNGSQSSFEWAIRVAANICRQLHVGNSRLEIVLFGLPSDLPRKAGNQNGLTPLLDFLAMIPSLEAVNSTEEDVTKVSAGRISQHVTTYLICTDDSSFVSESHDATYIVLKKKNFEVETGDTESQVYGHSGANSGDEWISISAPGNAVWDLKNGWARGSENVV